MAGPEGVLMLPDFTREQWWLAASTLMTVSGLGLSRLPWDRAWGAVADQLPMWKRGLGIDIAGVRIRDEARVRHTHIVGATGSGKTVLIEQLLLEDLKAGNGCLIIDPKGDRELYERVRHECKRIGREADLHLLSATFRDESAIWNPCGLGNVSELQSKFFNSAIYSEPHYAKWCEKALLQAFNRLVPGHPKGFTISEVVTDLERFCKELKSRDEKIEGLFLDFYNLAHGEWGSILGCGSDRRGNEVSLLNLTQKNQILFVDLPTEAKKVQSARIGRLLTQELMLISGLRKIFPSIRSAHPFSVYIDEFDAFATESFATFLNKARSSGFMIHIAHQTLSDLNRVSLEFAGQILGNCNVRFIFRQDDPDDAERWSRFLGTRSTVKRTYQTDGGMQTGRSSNRDVQEFVIGPDQIKSLGVGETVLSIKTDRITKIVRTKFDPAPVTASVPNPKHAPQTRAFGEGTPTPEPVAEKRDLSEMIPEKQNANPAPEDKESWGGFGSQKPEEK
ncbi:MAG: type IV secretion system DNA-binding domain-containing protein [Bdellovibrionales bacterium]|nr:type IV secretion system DNA-binding domain-containing protein [Bdellovibrionales bacterium]